MDICTFPNNFCYLRKSAATSLVTALYTIDDSEENLNEYFQLIESFLSDVSGINLWYFCCLPLPRIIFVKIVFKTILLTGDMVCGGFRP